MIHQKRFRPNKKDKKIKRRCAYCSIEFITIKGSKQKYCSKKCPAKTVRYSCVICNKQVERAICWGEGKFCTERCRQIWYLGHGVAEPLPPGMHLPVNPKRKQKILGGEPISKQDLFDFYGNTCIICDQKIDLSIDWPDPMSASVDHLVPLCLGGTHTWDNVAPAHLLCNNNKDSYIDYALIEKHQKIFKEIIRQKKEAVNGP